MRPKHMHDGAGDSGRDNANMEEEEDLVEYEFDY